MKKILIAFTIGLALAGCTNSETATDNDQTVDETVPSEEKLIESELVVSETEEDFEETIEKEQITDNPEENTVISNEEATPKSNETKPPTQSSEVRIVDNPTDILVLVNKENALPNDYSPNDLVAPNVPFYFDEDHPKRYMRLEAAKALEQLFAAAKEEDLELLGASGYRSYDRQKAIFASNVRTKGEEAARQVSAEAGQSEHQTGLTMDVTSRFVGYDLIEEFGETKEGLWLKDYAHEFGFIIRYPKGKEHITGYSYEPWHLRYIGKEAAAEIFQTGLTLEEYLQSK